MSAPFFTLPVSGVEVYNSLPALEKAQQALAHLDEFADVSEYSDDSALFLAPQDSLYELPHDQGQFNLSDFRALVHEYAELKHRMEELEK